MAQSIDSLMTFFDILRREFVIVDAKDVTKFTFTRSNGEVRYGLHAIITDGQSANKFINKQDWDALDVPLR